MKTKKIKYSLIGLGVVAICIGIGSYFIKQPIETLPVLRMNGVEQSLVEILSSEESKEQGVSSEETLFELRSRTDLMALEALCEDEGIDKIYVKDYIPTEYADDPVEALDLMDLFYYQIPYKYPKVEVVELVGNLQKVDPKIANKYSSLEIKNYTEVVEEESIKEESCTLIVPIEQKENQFVTYKINEQIVGQTSRYPYAFKVEEGMLENGLNEVKVILSEVNHEEPISTHTFYVEKEQQAIYDEREIRQGQQYAKEEQPVYDTGYIPVLMYHMFLEEVGKEEQSIAVSTQLFEEHLQRLLAEGYTVIDFKILKDYLEGESGLPEKPLILTADDGYQCNYEKAYPLLKKYGVPATFFVPTSLIGTNEYHDYFSWEEAREMEASGLVDIQSHSYRHYQMDKLEKAPVQYEMDHSFDQIEKHLGKRDVKVIAYPQFRHTDEVQEWVKERGVDLQVTDLVKRPVDTTPMEIKRIHVSNKMTSNDLIQAIEKVTRK